MTADALDLVKPLGVARRDDEQRVDAGGAHAIERANHRLFFTLQRAARDDDGPVRWNAEEAQHALASAAWRRRRFQRIELQAAGHRDACGIGAELDEPARRFFPLHAEAIDVREHAPDERPNHPVARKRSIRDPAVDDRRLDPPAATFAQQVRRDLGFDHHEQTRLDDVERAPRGEGPIEREVEHRIHIRHAAPCQLLTR